MMLFLFLSIDYRNVKLPDIVLGYFIELQNAVQQVKTESFSYLRVGSGFIAQKPLSTIYFRFGRIRLGFIFLFTYILELLVTFVCCL